MIDDQGGEGPPLDSGVKSSQFSSISEKFAGQRVHETANFIIKDFRVPKMELRNFAIPQFRRTYTIAAVSRI